MVGPPGTANSALARRLHGAFAGTRYFERLLTRFSTPEELFGPLSLKALEDDRYERLTDGYLPTAGIAFLDEVFKANSAILNTLLTLLNEREFDNGSVRLAVPLISVIGASNEVPSDEALLAFYDRFLVRVAVGGVSDAAFAALLALPSAAHAPPVAPLTADERAAVLAARDAVALGDDALAALRSLRTWLGSLEGGAPSDRRWRQFVGLMRVAAASEGRPALDALDLWLSPYVMAPEPGQAAANERWFIAQVAQSAPLDAAWLACVRSRPSSASSRSSSACPPTPTRPPRAPASWRWHAPWVQTTTAATAATVWPRCASLPPGSKRGSGAPTVHCTSRPAWRS